MKPKGKEYEDYQDIERRLEVAKSIRYLFIPSEQIKENLRRVYENAGRIYFQTQFLVYSEYDVIPICQYDYLNKSIENLNLRYNNHGFSKTNNRRY